MLWVPGCLRSTECIMEPCKGRGENSRKKRAAPRPLFPYTFMIFKAIASFLSVETSSSCFFFSLCRNWM